MTKPAFAQQAVQATTTWSEPGDVFSPPVRELRGPWSPASGGARTLNPMTMDKERKSLTGALDALVQMGPCRTRWSRCVMWTG